MNLKKGALHKELGISQKKTIPVATLQKAKNSNNPTLERRANLALEFRGFNKKKSSDSEGY